MFSSLHFRRTAFILMMLVVLCPIGVASYPQHVHAQTSPGLPTFDLGNFIKNTLTAANSPVIAGNTGITAITSQFQLLKGTALDPIAWAVSKAVLQSLVNSTVKWINSGFNGAPAFATNLSATLQAVGDTQANSFIKQLASNSAIKSPFQSQVASAVSTIYLQSTGANGFFNSNPFTLGNVSSNPTAFLGGGSSGFAQGGFNAWISTAMTSANNPYGAALLASQALKSQVAGAQSIQNKEFQAGNGFLSYRGNCQTTTTGQSTTGSGSAAAPGTAVVGQFCVSNADCSTGSSCVAGACSARASSGSASTGLSGSSLGGSLAASAATSPATSLSPNSGCQSQNIITPGSVIGNSLYKSLGSGIDTLVTANQFDEIVNALMSQLLNHVLGSGGLTGISQPSASTGGVAYFDQTSPTVAGTGTTPTATVNSDFTTTITEQIYGLQNFETNWSTIGSAASAAQNALLSSACTPNAQSIIAAQVQPIINESSNEIAEASSTIATLNTISAEAPPINPDGSPVTAAQTTQASTDYSCFLSSGEVAETNGTCAPANSVPTPSQSDIEYAQEQSIDTGTGAGITESLYTQMNQLAQEAQSCSVPNTSPVTPTAPITPTAPTL